MSIPNSVKIAEAAHEEPLLNARKRSKLNGVRS